MALKILDNFVLWGCGSTTASKNLRHMDGVRPSARGSASRDLTFAVTIVVASSLICSSMLHTSAAVI